ncbi:MAG: NADH-quinone oxidoreductase subunit H, partial [Pseudomonadota bacterium]
ETNRPPFDLPEAESELVAGYQVEYSSTPFLLFMIGELANIVLMCAMLTILFFGGWHSPIDVPILNQMPVFWFCLKIVFFFFLFAMVKAITPRYRYDQLMRIGWKLFLPVTMIYVVLVAGAMLFIPGVADLFQSWRTA